MIIDFLRSWQRAAELDKRTRFGRCFCLEYAEIRRRWLSLAPAPIPKSASIGIHEAPGTAPCELKPTLPNRQWHVKLHDAAVKLVEKQIFFSISTSQGLVRLWNLPYGISCTFYVREAG
jgi:hypothetical protein